MNYYKYEYIIHIITRSNVTTTIYLKYNIFESNKSKVIYFYNEAANPSMIILTNTVIWYLHSNLCRRCFPTNYNLCLNIHNSYFSLNFCVTISYNVVLISTHFVFYDFFNHFSHNFLRNNMFPSFCTNSITKAIVFEEMTSMVGINFYILFVL